MAINTTSETNNGETPISESTTPQIDESEAPSLHIFPGDVELSGHFMTFTAFTYSRETRGDPAARPGRVGSVVLPMPPQLSTAYGAQYNTGALDYAGFIAHDHLGRIINDMRRLYQDSRMDKNPDTNESVKEHLKAFGVDAIKHFPGYIGYQVLDAFENRELGRAAQLAGGFARNPHLALLFEGVGFRSHRFEYSFVARNLQESNALRDIIKFFKKAMHPKIDDTFANHLFNYPYEFEISMTNEEYLFHIGESVLTDFSVDYHSTGRPLYFETGQQSKAPVALTIHLEFTETSIVTQDEIEKENR